MTTATINRWCYAFDDDRSPPVTKKAPKPVDPIVAEPAPQKHHCAYCHTILHRGTKGVGVCDEEGCLKKFARDKDIQRLDRAHQQSGSGIGQRGKNRQ